MGLPDDAIARITALLSAELRIRLVYLFGSAARPGAVAPRDLDRPSPGGVGGQARLACRPSGRRQRRRPASAPITERPAASASGSGAGMGCVQSVPDSDESV
jgi:hypothetical protein